VNRKIKGRICEAAALLGSVGVFLTVGAVENFSIALSRGAVIMALCAGLSIAAVCVGCKEGH